MQSIPRGPWEGTIFRTKARGEQVYNPHKSPVYRVTPSHRGRQPFHLPRGNSSIFFFYITVPWRCSEPHPMFRSLFLVASVLLPLWGYDFTDRILFPPGTSANMLTILEVGKIGTWFFFRKLEFPKKVSNLGNGGIIVEVNCLHRQDGNSILKGNHTRGAEDQR